MEFHEPGPCLVEEEVVAERPELLEKDSGAIDCAVVCALLDDSDAERPFSPPSIRILD